MRDPVLSPRDLPRRPGWAQLGTERIAAVLEALEALDDDASGDLEAEVRSQLGLEAVGRQTLVRELGARTMADFVRSWDPNKRALAVGDKALGRALGLLVRDVVAGVDADADEDDAPRLTGLVAGAGYARDAVMKTDVAILGRRVARHQKEIYDYGTSYGPGLPTWGSSLTLGHWLTLRDTSLRAAQRWVQSLLNVVEQREVADLPTRRARMQAWEGESASPKWGAEVRAALELRLSQMRPEVLRPDAPLRQSLQAGWVPEHARLVITSRTLLSCLTHESCDEATIELGDPTRPTVQCRFAGKKPCTLKLMAVEAMLDLLQPETPSNPLREFIARPGWQRLIDRLEAVQKQSDLTLRSTEPEATLGWVYSPSDAAGGEVELMWVRPRKRQDGLTANKVSSAKHEVDAQLEDPRDRVAWLIAKGERATAVGTSEARAGATLSALIDHPRVYVRWVGELYPVKVVAVDPAVGVEPLADGSAKLVVKVADRLHVPARRPNAGEWLVRAEPEAGRLYVGRWTKASVAAWDAWEKAPTAVPSEARDVLAQTMVALAKDVNVAFDASWLGEAVPPDDRVVVRVGFAGPKDAKHLTIDALVRPVPELGAMSPGAGTEIVPLRRETGLAHVARDFARERESVAEIANALGVPETATAWRIDHLEGALEAVARLDDIARESAGRVTLEWQTKRPRVTRATKADRVSLKLGVKRDWLGIAGGIQLDGGELPIAELLDALRDKKRFVALDDERFVELDETLRTSLAPLALVARKERQGLGASLLAAPILKELEGQGLVIEAPPQWLEVRSRLDASATLDVPVPSDLRAELRPYQIEGYQWAARLAHWAKGACLADDMGLGKTLQALALLLLRKDLGLQLVVAPTSVVPNWLREAARFAPDLEPVVISGQGNVDRLKSLGSQSLVITTYDVLVRNEAAFELRWATLVIDEAHAIKNAATKRAQAIKGLDAGFCLALTGTPVENRPSELWSLFQAVAPGLLGSAESFREHFARPIEQDKDHDTARRLARLVRPFILRRTKAEVAQDLPPRVEVRVDVVLGPDERERYERVRKSALAELEKRDPLGEGGRGLVRVLAVLMRLRQLACHPKLVEPDADVQVTGGSAKLERLVQLLEELRAERRHALVFSQFTELLALVRVALDEAGITYAYLDGSTPGEKRIAEVDRFQSGQVDCFLLSLKAGGVGLNLTTASEVVLLDPWWNPAVEDQAADRAHRIGQDKAVTIYRLVSQGTIEEQILALHGDKRAMVSSLLEGTASPKAITAEELVALLAEG